MIYEENPNNVDLTHVVDENQTDSVDVDQKSTNLFEKISVLLANSPIIGWIIVGLFIITVTFTVFYFIQQQRQAERSRNINPTTVDVTKK